MTRQARGQGRNTTKTAAGRRQVKLLTPAFAALKAQREYTDHALEAIFRDPRTRKRWADHGKIYDVWQINQQLT